MSLVYDPYTPGFSERAHSVYDHLRARGTIQWSSRVGAWVVTGHADAKRILRSPAWLPSDVASEIGQVERMSRVRLPAIRQLAAEMVFFRTGPGHLQARRFLGRVLNHRPLAELEPEIQVRVANLFQGLVNDGGGDLVSAVARPLPQCIMGEMLGVTLDDMAFLADCAEDIAVVTDLEMEMDRLIEANTRAAMALDLLGGLCAERLRSPQEDGLTRLSRQGVEEGLAEREIAARAFFLFVAGLETTTTFLSAAMQTLLQHPDEASRWQRGEVSDTTAVEELLRFTTPITLVTRMATEVTHVGGQIVAPGDRAFVLLEAVNRDPEVFFDPHHLDLGRAPGPHLAFGDGVHACLGASLARMQASVALRRFTGVRTVLVSDTKRDGRSQVIRPLATLVVKLT